METTYIKEIQVNNNSVTAINNCNQIVNWLSSIVTEIEETGGVVTISKTDGTTINIPLEQGISESDVNKKLASYYTELEVNDIIEKLKLEFDKYITEDRFRMIMDINSGSSSCSSGCGDSCCGFNTCCLNFLTALVDNRDCCGGITIIDNMGNQTNILEELKVHDITDNGDGTYHITKCNEEWDTTRTQVIDNGDGTYTFINWDGSEFTLELQALPTLSKYVIFNGVDQDAWYPLEDAVTNCIPVPGYDLLDFQNIDIVWTDVDAGTTSAIQQNQYTHNGNLVSYSGATSTLNCLDPVGSHGFDRVYPYNYRIVDNYTVTGVTIADDILEDVALGFVIVSMGVPMTDLTKVAKQLSEYSEQQLALVTGNAADEFNTVYEIWKDQGKYGRQAHLEASEYLMTYLNNTDETVIEETRAAAQTFVAELGGE